MIGYCPQTNHLFESLSVWQNIDYFAQLKGIAEVERKKLVSDVLQRLDLVQYQDRQAGALSGGNKRKLCVAIAIIGSPPIILLDEPSAGMDPESRKFMWQVVERIASEKTSAVVLTTHSMEEAEALSQKMGIMVHGGVFKCFGSALHIKEKYGTNYIIEFKVCQPDKEMLIELANGVNEGRNTADIGDMKDLSKKLSLQAVHRFVSDGTEKLGPIVKVYVLMNLL